MRGETHGFHAGTTSPIPRCGGWRRVTSPKVSALSTHNRARRGALGALFHGMATSNVVNSQARAEGERANPEAAKLSRRACQGQGPCRTSRTSGLHSHGLRGSGSSVAQKVKQVRGSGGDTIRSSAAQDIRVQRCRNCDVTAQSICRARRFGTVYL
jgi:hypothetical protein